MLGAKGLLPEPVSSLDWLGASASSLFLGGLNMVARGYFPSAFPSSSRETSQKVNGMSGVKVSKFGQACPHRLTSFLRAAHPIKTAECVADRIGVPASTVRKWLDGSSAPGFRATWALIGAYGIPIIVAVFDVSPSWASDEFRAARMNELQARRAALDEEMRAMLAD